MLLRERILLNLRRLLKTAAVLAALLVVLAAATVEHTSKSKFCSSCHIMKPYYESWKASSHNQVDCVDCHYEPGLLETVQGKFKALSQLAKYVTGTQGTKPWAEVDDKSCTRSGCHSERLLEGTIPFGRIRFDHRHHLLEMRRGRRLRCTTCHSQIVQGRHIAVTESACFLCHFRASKESPSHGECDTCHGPPEEALEVAGRPFRHLDYTERGVACVLCHRNVTRGEGLARKNRCDSCHGETAHIERFDDTDFIHENHITLHKVECDECHDEIQHSLEDIDHFESAGDCGECHSSRHDRQWRMMAGRGAPGVEDRPSRMFQTRVDCTACHSEPWKGRQDAGPAGEVAPASPIACMHCHGPRFAEMQDDWQREVHGALEPLEAAAAKLEASVPAGGAGGGGAGEAPEGLAAARRCLEIVREDGSLGVHNIAYALSILREARDRINEAGAALAAGSFEPLSLEIGLPVESSQDCARACHVDVARRRVPFGDVPFPHRPHLVSAGLDCDDCHSDGSPLDPGSSHGRTVIGPSDCTSCHHDREEPGCSACHQGQAALLRGTVRIEGLELDLDLAGPMSDLDCTDCHTDLGPDATAAARSACTDCHEEGYGEKVDAWRKSAAEAAGELAGRIETLRARLDAARAAGGAPEGAPQALLEGVRCYEAAVKGGAQHNPGGVEALLSAARERLDRCRALLGN